MKNLDDDFFRIDQGDGLFLNSGDEVIIQIEHELTGTIQKTLIVPAPIPGFTLNHPMEKVIVNTNNSITMSWNKYDCSEYGVSISRYTENEQLDSFSDYTSDTTYTWDDFFLKNGRQLIPYLTISLLAENSVYLESFNEFSRISVGAPKYAYKSNYK